MKLIGRGVELLVMCFPSVVQQVKTVPYDPRFPATNQARNCYTRYNEYYKCAPSLPPLPRGKRCARLRSVQKS